jgi:hypothetical protein
VLAHDGWMSKLSTCGGIGSGVEARSIHLGVEACLGPAATAEPMHVTNPETSGKVFKVNILLALNLIPQI